MSIRPLSMLGIALVCAVAPACSRNTGESPEGATGAGPQPVVAPTAERTAWQGLGWVTPDFPSEAEAKQMGLDYATFGFAEAQGFSITPLPPYLGQSVRVRLSAGAYRVRAGSEQCKSPIVVTLAGSGPMQLDPTSGESREIRIDTPAGEPLAVAMAAGAENNFSCGVVVTRMVPGIANVGSAQPAVAPAAPPADTAPSMR